jgi:hypothetical protein
MRPGDEEVERLQRLTETSDAASPAEARLRDLVQASGGVEVSDTAKGKIYASVLARRQTRHAQRFVLLRPAVAFGVVLVAAGATAAATLGHRWMRQRGVPVAAPAAPAPVEPRARPAAPRHEDVVAPAPAPVEIPATAPESRRPHAPRARARSEDPSAVVTALEALRKQHDPDRAAKLLAGYLAAYPKGALAEEALALSIEAAVARHDPAAMEFARRYLRAYPSGRFWQTAEAALARR